MSFLANWKKNIHLCFSDFCTYLNDLRNGKLQYLFKGDEAQKSEKSETFEFSQGLTKSQVRSTSNKNLAMHKD